MKRTLLVCVVALVAHAVAAQAADRPPIDIAAAVATTVVVADVAADVAAPQVFVAATARVLPAPGAGAGKRSPLLLAMYGAAGVLQAYDGYSTIKAVAAGHVKMNPIMAPLVKHPGLVIAAKAAMTVATIAAAENLWRTHHRRQAIAMLVVSNSLMAYGGAHNAMVLRGQR